MSNALARPRPLILARESERPVDARPGVENAGLGKPSIGLSVITLTPAVTAAVVAFYQFGWIRALPRTRGALRARLNIAIEAGRTGLSATFSVRRCQSASRWHWLASPVCSASQSRQRGILFRQPGVAACTRRVVSALITAGTTPVLWLVRRIEFQEDSEWLSHGFPLGILFEIAARHASFCVVAVWAFLAIGGLWSFGRSWVNWLGATVGAYARFLNAFLWVLAMKELHRG